MASQSVEDVIWAEVMDELERADIKYGGMAESVEGLYTLRCEVMELAREVHRKNKSAVAKRKEAIQTAAMAVKFIRDCCQETYYK